VVLLGNESAKYFPYPEVRPHQGEFIKTVENAVQDKRSVLIEGCNGLGKTIAALSACLPIAFEKDMKILYVARTHRQHDRVIQELKEVSRRRPTSGVSVRGRHEMCLNPIVTDKVLDARSAMDVCELLKARGRCRFYANIEEKSGEYFSVQQLLTETPHDASEIQSVCRRKQFCPYELVKNLMADVKVVALSYLYVFDPMIRALFLKSLETPLNKLILVVDEAHNLPETAADIASSSLSLFAVRHAELEARRFGYKDIAEFANIVRSEVEEEIRKVGKEMLVSPDFLLDLVRDKADVHEPRKFFQQLCKTGNAVRRDLLLEGKYPRSFIYSMGDFLLKWLETAQDDSFVHAVCKYFSRHRGITGRLEVVALDPSRITEPVFSETYANVIMSGTLQPLDAYLCITRLPEETVRAVVPSPFPPENILPVISLGTTTAMEKRTPETYRKIVRRIVEVVENTPANVGVFSPSFEVMDRLKAEGLEGAVNRPAFFERREMSSRENERMVNDFKERSTQGGALLFGVLGGRSSEGVDYPGDEMNSVVIVGVPYAEPTPRVKAQINYFEKCFPKFGREYGYVIPAMKKASQAAGRPIRTLTDRGAMIFLDHRFATSYCRSFLPSWIRQNLKILPDIDGTIAKELKGFFGDGY
jgi:DNA excision repair protein ERCC-2